MLATRGLSFQGKRVAISGSGNVAQYAAEKVSALGGTVITLSDSSGSVLDESGIDGEKWCYVMELKNFRRGRVREYAETFPEARYAEGKTPWQLAPADIVLPCAIQNELDEEDAKELVKNGCVCVAEGANMPCTPGAISCFQSSGVLFGPGKAANAGGVACSGLEMIQNSMRMTWSRQEVDEKLQRIMITIHQNCLDAAEEYGSPGNYVKGANIAGFRKVADAMLDQGLV
jgi:glutamate dehydrogenase (NADP+)